MFNIVMANLTKWFLRPPKYDVLPYSSTLLFIDKPIQSIYSGHYNQLNAFQTLWHPGQTALLLLSLHRSQTHSNYLLLHSALPHNLQDIDHCYLWISSVLLGYNIAWVIDYSLILFMALLILKITCRSYIWGTVIYYSFKKTILRGLEFCAGDKNNTEPSRHNRTDVHVHSQTVAAHTGPVQV